MTLLADDKTGGSGGTGAGAGDGGTGAGGSGGAGAGGAGSGGAASWRDSLPEDIRGNPAISSFQDVASLTKSFIHAQSALGKKGVTVPGEKGTPEDWQNFFKSIGVPEADKYTVEAPKDTKLPDTTMNWFKENAIKNGLLPKQANQLLDAYVQFEKGTIAAQAKTAKEAMEKSHTDLKTEWGDGYDKKIGAVQLLIKEHGGPDFLKYLNESGLGNDVKLIKAFEGFTKLLSEDKLREGGVGSGGNSRDEIQAQLNELRANGDKNGLFNKNDPMHDVTLKKMESLAKQLTGGR